MNALREASPTPSTREADDADLLVRLRWVAAAGAALALLVTIVSAAGFIAWVNLDNTITWPALEMSRTAVYPPNHGLYGAVLAIVFAGSLALGVGLGWLAVPGQLRGSMVHFFCVAWFALSIGAAAPVIVQHSIVLASPILGSAIAAFIVARTTIKSRRD